MHGVWYKLFHSRLFNSAPTTLVDLTFLLTIREARHAGKNTSARSENSHKRLPQRSLLFPTLPR